MNPVRLVVYSLAAAASSCAGTPENAADRPVRSACGGLECFRERDIRDVQLLDQDTMIVFVGPQRCAFRMELEGTNCGFVGFTVDFDLDQRSRLVGDQARICIYDRPYIRDPLSRQSAEGVMPGGRGPAPSTTDFLRQCRVDQIIPLSDDELLEAYVETGSQAPLPPVGSGEISVGEAEEGAETGAGEASDEPGNAGDASPAT